MVGRKLEESIESLMSLSSEVASIQAELDNAKSELAMFSMLYDINQCMSENLEVSKLTPLIEDVVLGMVGASYSAVVLTDIPFRFSADLGVTLSYMDLCSTITDSMFIEDLKLTPMLGLTKGGLYIHKMNITEEDSGYLVVYWTVGIGEKDKKLQFLSILSTQVGLALRNARLMEKLRCMALHDPLTGICNRTRLNNIESSATPKIGECTVMFDIDDFKKINDTSGHTYGDTVLQEFANILKQCAKESNATCFRYGGEEFVLKCDGDEWEGLRLANLVRERFTSKTGYTVSAGVSAIGESCKLRDYKSLIELADASMYVSKQSGKNRVTMSNSDIQLFQKADDDLCTLLDMRYKNPTAKMHNLIRLDILSNCTVTLDEFEEFRAIVQRCCTRAYVTESLAVLFITEPECKVEEAIKDIERALAEQYPNFEYVISVCNNIFNEVSAHSSRVAYMVKQFGVQLGLSEEDINSLVIACDWHDIGKLCISPAIYSKPGKLTPFEFDRIKYHAWLGYSIAKKTQHLRYCADWILKHHENYDGSGYYGYTGDNTPLPAQILGLLDKFDALTEDRCYRKAYSCEEALEILKKEEHTFNPILFKTFLNVIPKNYQK